jgi:hypothetical protein
MRMVRRANMGPFHSSREGKSQSPAGFPTTPAGHGFGWRGRAGFPATIWLAATSRVTTLPAPITAPSPIVTPGRMMAPPPIQTSLPMHRTAEFEAGTARFDIARMVGGINLHRGSDLGAVADRNIDDIQDDAVEIEEHLVAEADIVAVVAKERRTDNNALADIAEMLRQQGMTLGNRRGQRRIVAHEPGRVRDRIRLQFRIARTIQFAGQHLLLFGLAQPITPSFGNAPGAAASAARALALSSFI